MLQAGIVGLPNVGKSTLFNAVTHSRKAEAANYPFCTIEPNQGVVTVPDERLAVLSKISKSQKIIPAAIEFVDIAGLVKGASQGEGLGNQFLSHIREVDAIVQVVRCFENDDIHHVSGGIDPIRDIEVINTELILADLSSVEKRRERNEKNAKRGDKEAKTEMDLCDLLLPHLNAGKPALTVECSEADKKLLKGLFLLSSKPTIYACNVAEDQLGPATKDLDSHPHVKAVRQYAREHHGANACVISAAIEAELVDLSDEEAREYLKDLGAEGSGISTLIKAVYELLGLRTYLTTGEKETRAWTFVAGMKAPQCAGVIHSDFERGFIAAEVTAYKDLVELGSFAKARESGKLRIEGKEYVVQDGDVSGVAIQRLAPARAALRMIMNYPDAINWLYSAQQFGVKLGLENTERLMAVTGHPGRRLRFIHVAGTNGKGSVCAMMAAVCQEAGLKTGLFTSPHLIRFTERIKINDREIPRDDVAEGLSLLRSLTEKWDHPPTFFELAFALALRWFAMEKADIVILETGLGGRLDATNVVTPLVSVITSISLDHEQWLGDTLGKIAMEKAGIIKHRIPVVSAPQDPAVAEVVAARARELHSPLTMIDQPYCGGPIGLAGPHQAINAAVAAAGLAAAGIREIQPGHVVDGIARARWPARFQSVGSRIILDGAHNPAGAEALAETWRRIFPDRKATVIFSAVAGKDVRNVVRCLSLIAIRWIPLQIQTQRGLSVETLTSLCREVSDQVTPARTADEALKLALTEKDAVLVAGSLYLCGEILAALESTGNAFETSDQ